jgi:carbamoyltransferase
MREALPRRLYVSPNPSDCGQSLGCALAGAYELARWTPPLRELPDYLGPACTESELKESCRRAGVECVQLPDADELVAKCLANGHIVARYAGCAEFGPRALGNRSILCDPRRPNMKDRLNARVKHRESFRPFAPTVLEGHAHKWFHLEGRSSYMLLVVGVRDDVKNVIPAIVHVDGTARVQTVSERENPGYWRLIESFYRLTGVPLVLNTSFNVQGKPIVETPAQAADCFLSTEIDVLYMSGYVLSKKPLREYLEQEAV